MKKWNKTLYKDIYKNKDKEKQIELELQKLQNEFFLKNSEISLLLQRNQEQIKIGMQEGEDDE